MHSQWSQTIEGALKGVSDTTTEKGYQWSVLFCIDSEGPIYVSIFILQPG